MDNGQKIKLHVQCWNIAGLKHFMHIIFMRCKAYLVMFDIAKMQSFNSVTKWRNKVSDYGDNSNPLLLLVGSKLT